MNAGNQFKTRTAVATASAPDSHDKLADFMARSGLVFEAPAEAGDNRFQFVFNDRAFRLFAPRQASGALLVADVFTGDESEVLQLGGALLHANYQCQMMGILSQPYPAENGSDPVMGLPVMGLDIERMTVVISLSMPLETLAQEGAQQTFLDLLGIIDRDATTLVQQFRLARR
jgi:hypothetical protein